MTEHTVSSWDAAPAAPASQAPIAPALLSVAQQFAYFARHECQDDPLYVALSEAAAAQPRRLASFEAAPPTQARPVLWLAAIHDRLLELADAGVRPPLAAWYRSLGGERAPDDAALPAALDAFLAAEDEALRRRISTRATQTNEIGRSAVLAPLLADLASRHGGRPLALLDVGCSAGLNLGVDRFHYRYLDPVDGRVVASRRGTGDAAPTLDCRLAGGTPPPGHATIAHRLGLDIAPVDVADAGAVRWLHACLWPSDLARRARFDAALAIARRERWAVRETHDVTEAVDEWLATLPGDVLPVVFNSWVLAYFDAEVLARFQRRLLERVAQGRLAWISAEMGRFMRGAWPGLPAPTEAESAAAAHAGVSAHDLGVSTDWAIAEPGGSGIGDGGKGGDAIRWRLAARSHGHGRWAQFLGDTGR